MYKVESLEIKSGLFGTTYAKTDAQIADFINAHESEGWELVSMNEINSDSKNFWYRFTFKKKA